MATDSDRKLKIMLDMVKPGTVCLASWLKENGISHDLQAYYRRNGWLTSIGKGAFTWSSDSVDWQAGLHALQSQAGLPIHTGALTALSLQGLGHYVRMDSETLYLFAPPKTPFPAWFKNHDWNTDVQFNRTSTFPEGLGLTDYEGRTTSFKISTPELAMLECLSLVPAKLDFMECAQLMEGLTTLRPRVLQPILEKTGSIKVKRLFLYLAEWADHAWLKRLDDTRINLGHGDRSIIKGGTYVGKYGITVPKEMVRS